MSKLLWGFVGLALIAAPASAEDKKTDAKKVDEKKTDEKKPETRRPVLASLGARQPGGVFQFGRTQGLLSEKEMEDLKLSSDQKEKVSKIVKDYDAKAKEAREEMQKLFQGGQPDREKMRAAREASTKAREDAESKVTALLTDDQKKKFEEQKRSRRTSFERGAFGAPFKAGQVIPGAAKERLELNDEQKKKIEELEKEVKGKLEKILNADQLKKLEQPAGGRGRPGADGTRPRRPGADGQPRRPRPDQN